MGITFDFNSRRFTKTLATTMAGVMLYSTVASPWAEAAVARRSAGFWQERQKSVPARRAPSGSPSTQVAQLSPANPGLAQALPSVTESAPLARLTNFSGIPDRHPRLKNLPDWLQKIPSAYGDVQKARIATAGPDAPLVILIQDVHDAAAAQLNIAGILRHLHKQIPLARIGLEGAAGAFDLSSYRAPESAEHREILAKFLLEHKFFTGPEYFAAVSEEEPRLWGVETEASYAANVEAYRDGARQKAALDNIIAAHRRSLNALREKILTPPLRELDDDIASYQRGTVDLAKHLQTLLKQGQGLLPRFPQTRRLADLLRMENALDFKQVEAERGRLIHVLSARLSEAAVQKLLEASLAFRSGQMGRGAYYDFFRTFTESQGLKLSAYPQFAAYVRYALSAEEIDRHKLFDEVADFQQAVVARATATPEQKEWMALSEDLRLLERLKENEFGPAEWERYAAQRENILSMDHRLTALGAFKAQKAEDSSPLAPILAPYENFYRAADQRNADMVQNLLRSPGKEASPSVAVLVAGGFHTPGLERILLDKNVSVVTVTPKLGEVPADGNKYLGLFAMDRIPVEKMLLGEKLYLAMQRASAARPLAPQFADFIAKVRGIAEAATKALSNPGSVHPVGRSMPGFVVSFARGGLFFRQRPSFLPFDVQPMEILAFFATVWTALATAVSPQLSFTAASGLISRTAPLTAVLLFWAAYFWLRSQQTPPAAPQPAGLGSRTGQRTSAPPSNVLQMKASPTSADSDRERKILEAEVRYFVKRIKEMDSDFYVLTEYRQLLSKLAPKGYLPLDNAADHAHRAELCSEAFVAAMSRLKILIQNSYEETAMTGEELRDWRLSHLDKRPVQIHDLVASTRKAFEGFEEDVLAVTKAVARRTLQGPGQIPPADALSLTPAQRPDSPASQGESELRAILSDPARLSTLLETMSLLRLFYPQEMESDLSPLDQINALGTVFPLAENLFFSPQVDSFRRQLVFIKQNDGSYATLELKMPGEDFDRLVMSRTAFDIAQTLTDRFGPNEVVAAPRFLVEARGIFWLYGRPVRFDKDALTVTAFDYLDGTRISYMGTPNSPETKKRVVVDCLKAMLAIHEIGYAINLGGHLGNYRLIPPNKVVMVGDLLSAEPLGPGNEFGQIDLIFLRELLSGKGYVNKPLDVLRYITEAQRALDALRRSPSATWGSTVKVAESIDRFAARLQKRAPRSPEEIIRFAATRVAWWWEPLQTAGVALLVWGLPALLGNAPFGALAAAIASSLLFAYRHDYYYFPDGSSVQLAPPLTLKGIGQRAPFFFLSLIFHGPLYLVLGGFTGTTFSLLGLTVNSLIGSFVYSAATHAIYNLSVYAGLPLPSAVQSSDDDIPAALKRLASKPVKISLENGKTVLREFPGVPGWGSDPVANLQLQRPFILETDTDDEIESLMKTRMRTLNALADKDLARLQEIVVIGPGTSLVEALMFLQLDQYGTSRVTLVEWFPGNFQKLYANWSQLDPRIRARIVLVQGDAKRLDSLLGLESADLIHTRSTFGVEVLGPSGQREALNAAARVLKPGGYLLPSLAMEVGNHKARDPLFNYFDDPQWEKKTKPASPEDMITHVLRQRNKRPATARVWAPEEILAHFKGKEIPPIVTGGTGFVGSTLLDKLIVEGRPTIALVRSDDLKKMAGVLGRPGSENIFIVNVDDYLHPGNRAAMEALIQRSPLIYHLAAQAIAGMTTDPTQPNTRENTFLSNALLTGYLAALAKKNGKKMVYTSSVHIYTLLPGLKDETVDESVPIEDHFSPDTKRFLEIFHEKFAAYIRLLTEEDPARIGQEPKDFIDGFLALPEIAALLESPNISSDLKNGFYSLSKVAAERFVMDLPPGNAIVVRFANVVGPRQGRNVITIFMEKIFNREPVTVTPDTRSFQYVGDAARAVRLAGEALLDNRTDENHVILIGPEGEPLKMAQVFDAVRSAFGQERYPFAINQTANPFYMPRLNTSLARTILGWTPAYTAWEAIETTAHYLRNLAGDKEHDESGNIPPPTATWDSTVTLAFRLNQLWPGRFGIEGKRFDAKALDPSDPGHAALVQLAATRVAWWWEPLQTAGVALLVWGLPALLGSAPFGALAAAIASSLFFAYRHDFYYFPDGTSVQLASPGTPKGLFQRLPFFFLSLIFHGPLYLVLGGFTGTTFSLLGLTINSLIGSFVAAAASHAAYNLAVLAGLPLPSATQSRADSSSQADAEDISLGDVFVWTKGRFLPKTKGSVPIFFQGEKVGYIEITEDDSSRPLFHEIDPYEEPEEPQTRYVCMVNVAPAFRGRGIGSLARWQLEMAFQEEGVTLIRKPVSSAGMRMMRKFDSLMRTPPAVSGLALAIATGITRLFPSLLNVPAQENTPSPVEPLADASLKEPGPVSQRIPWRVTDDTHIAQSIAGKGRYPSIDYNIILRKRPDQIKTFDDIFEDLFERIESLPPPEDGVSVELQIWIDMIDRLIEVDYIYKDPSVNLSLYPEIISIFKTHFPGYKVRSDINGFMAAVGNLRYLRGTVLRAFNENASEKRIPIDLKGRDLAALVRQSLAEALVDKGIPVPVTDTDGWQELFDIVRARGLLTLDELRDINFPDEISVLEVSSVVPGPAQALPAPDQADDEAFSPPNAAHDAALVNFAAKWVAPWFEPLIVLGIPFLIRVAFGPLSPLATLIVAAASAVAFGYLHDGAYYPVKDENGGITLEYRTFNSRRTWKGFTDRLPLIGIGLVFHLPFYLVFGGAINLASILLSSLWAIVSHGGYNRLAIAGRITGPVALLADDDNIPRIKEDVSGIRRNAADFSGNPPFSAIRYKIDLWTDGGSTLTIEDLYGDMFRKIQKAADAMPPQPDRKTPKVSIERRIDMRRRTIHLFLIEKTPGLPVKLHEEEAAVFSRYFPGYKIISGDSDSDGVIGFGAAASLERFYGARIVGAFTKDHRHVPHDVWRGLSLRELLDETIRARQDGEMPPGNNYFARGIGYLYLEGEVPQVPIKGNGVKPETPTPAATAGWSIKAAEWMLNVTPSTAAEKAAIVRFAAKWVAPWFEPLIVLGIPFLIRVAFGPLSPLATLIVAAASAVAFGYLHDGAYYPVKDENGGITLEYRTFNSRRTWKGFTDRLPLIGIGLVFHLPFYLVFGGAINLASILLSSLWAIVSHGGYNRLAIAGRVTGPMAMAAEPIPGTVRRAQTRIERDLAKKQIAGLLELNKDLRLWVGPRMQNGGFSIRAEKGINVSTFRVDADGIITGPIEMKNQVPRFDLRWSREGVDILAEGAPVARIEADEPWKGLKPVTLIVLNIGQFTTIQLTSDPDYEPEKGAVEIYWDVLPDRRFEMSIHHVYFNHLDLSGEYGNQNLANMGIMSTIIGAIEDSWGRLPEVMRYHNTFNVETREPIFQAVKLWLEGKHDRVRQNYPGNKSHLALDQFYLDVQKHNPELLPEFIAAAESALPETLFGRDLIRRGYRVRIEWKHTLDKWTAFDVVGEWPGTSSHTGTATWGSTVKVAELFARGLERDDLVRFVAKWVAPWFEPLIVLGIPFLIRVAFGPLSPLATLIVAAASAVAFGYLHDGAYYPVRDENGDITLEYRTFNSRRTWKGFTDRLPLIGIGLVFHLPFYLVFGGALNLASILLPSLWAIVSHGGYNRLAIAGRVKGPMALMDDDNNTDEPLIKRINTVDDQLGKMRDVIAAFALLFKSFVKPGDRILEIGQGSSPITGVVLSLLGGKYEGVDIAESRVAGAIQGSLKIFQTLKPTRSIPPRYHHGDATAITASKEYDHVIMFSVMSDPSIDPDVKRKILKQALLAVKPGGHLFLRVYQFESLDIEEIAETAEALGLRAERMKVSKPSNGHLDKTFCFRITSGERKDGGYGIPVMSVVLPIGAENPSPMTAVIIIAAASVVLGASLLRKNLRSADRLATMQAEGNDPAAEMSRSAEILRLMPDIATAVPEAHVRMDDVKTQVLGQGLDVPRTAPRITIASALWNIARRPVLFLKGMIGLWKSAGHFILARAADLDRLTTPLIDGTGIDSMSDDELLRFLQRLGRAPIAKGMLIVNDERRTRQRLEQMAAADPQASAFLEKIRSDELIVTALSRLSPARVHGRIQIDVSDIAKQFNLRFTGLITYKDTPLDIPALADQLGITAVLVWALDALFVYSPEKGLIGDFFRAQDAVRQAISASA